MKKKLLAAAMAAIAALMLGVGAAYAATQPAQASQDNPNGATSAPHKQEMKGKHVRFHRGVRGQAVVKDKQAPGGFATVAFAKGEITAVNGSQISVKEADGTSQNFTLNSATRVRLDKKESSATNLKAGMRVMVLTKQVNGQPAQVTGVAARANAPKHAAPKPGQPSTGQPAPSTT